MIQRLTNFKKFLTGMAIVTDRQVVQFPNILFRINCKSKFVNQYIINEMLGKRVSYVSFRLTLFKKAQRIIRNSIAIKIIDQNMDRIFTANDGSS